MKRNYGPFLVMIAAGLWAVDALFRTELTKSISPSAIVFYEHLIGFVILSPFFFKALTQFKKLNSEDWSMLLLLTLVSSVLGTLLFTEALMRSFSVGDFATPILLQKLQPIFVIILAGSFLRERITLRFITLVGIALAGSYMISFGTDPISLSFSDKEIIYLLAIGAAAAWGSGTVMSKQILKKLSFSTATSLRFLLAIPIAYIAMLILNQTYPVSELAGGQLLRFLIIAFTTGAGAVLIYYRGLQKTEAKVATVAELTFPIVSILIAITALNPFGDPQKFSLANGFGIAILLISILVISFDYQKYSN
ncbi:MAG: DMT family transporter [Parcubacteria group bacterium]